MASFKNLANLSATQAAKALAQREIKAEDLLNDCLNQIGIREPEVHAWVSFAKIHAQTQARELDRGPIQGILHGLPIGVKDLFDTHDLPTNYGSPIYGNNHPVCDAVSVSLMREAGAIVLGKTVTTEFASFKPGPTRNPRNLDHTPGGSSSGSAAAVADCMVPLATGSQTAASIIRPASYCGVVGYKPSYGKISIGGVKSLSVSLDTLGVFGRTVSDVALGVAAMSADHDLMNITPLESKIRVGICKTDDFALVQPETAAALSLASFAAKGFAKGGVGEIALPMDCAKLSETQTTIMLFEMAKSFTFEKLNHFDQISPTLKAIIERGDAIAYDHYHDALLKAKLARAAIKQLFEDQVDILIAPSAPGEAPKTLEQTGDPIFSRGWTLLGLPCINLTVTAGPNGLPVGVTLVAGPGQDRLLLSTANALAQQLSDPIAINQS
jgi:Asp-tRNA(Asn)/Glu-tRNA(Gln) amidotransferase A subunit family amidase